MIYVSKNNKTAVNTSLCWGGSDTIPCSNLTVAFEGAYVYNDTTMRFDGLYSPYQLDASPFTTFENIRSLRLESYGMNQVVIHCSNGSGLSFFSVSNISIVNISFVGCGADHSSTSTNSSSDADLFLIYSAALYFVNCADVIMDRVNVSQSVGVAIQFYATQGVNSITSCNLVDNNSPEGVNGISGGLYIEYPHCLPNSSGNSCSPLENAVNNSLFTIKDCLFSNNYASTGTVVKPNHVSKTETRNQFGSGGGISVSYDGSSNSNKVSIVDCTFSSNSATLRGGGVYADFKSDSFNNTVTMVTSSIDSCTAFAGGAIAVFYYNFDSMLFSNNSVYISSTNFTNNLAKFWGGAISLYITRKTTPSNQFNLTNCIFDGNTGSFGSAVSFSLWLSSSSGADNQLLPVVDSCLFVDNHDTKAFGSQELAQFGALYLYFLSVSFLKKVEFRSNYGSGVVAVSAEIRFYEGTESFFINNSAIHGAGISLLGNSIMKLFQNTSYHFLNNSAYLFGGAIYSSSVGEHTAMSQNCFMQYEKPYASPRDWEVRFTFINNTVDGTNKTDSIAGTGDKLNSIYAQSILPCLGIIAHQEESSIDPATKREVFCWNKTMWHYSSPECWQEIQTAPAKILVPESLVVKPGVDTSMDIIAYDDLSNDVTDYLVLFAQSTTPDITIDRRYHYISSNTIKLHPNENYTVDNVYTIRLQTLPSRVLETQLDVTFAKCTEGLELEDGVCTFIGSYGDYLRLNKTSGLAEVFREYWFGVRQDNKTKIVAYCRFCNGFSSNNPYIGGYIPLNFTSDENDACSVGRRKGFLCSECEDNHSISIFSTDQQCKNTSSLYNGVVWAVYVGSHILYYILLAVFIMVTNISFTAAPLNSAIIFAQMVSTVVDLNAGGIISLPGLKTTVRVYKCLYDLFNLNLFHVLFHHLTTSLPLPLAKIFLGFLPLLTLIAVSIIWCLISCCLCFDGNCFVRYKELHPNAWIVKKCTMFTVTEKMKNMLGSFLLLSSTSILIILFQVINPTFLRSSNGTIIGSVFYLDPGTEYSLGHFYFWLPIILISVFVIPLIFFICCCRYRDNNDKNIIDHMLHPLQCHFKRCEPKNYCEGCIEQVEIPKDPETADEIEKKRLQEEFPFKFSYRCLRLPPCCNNLIFISFRDFHWVPAGFFILRIGLILMYNYAWDFIIRCMMQLVTVAAVAAFIAIYRPYKKEWINALDTVIFLDLALLIALSAYQYHLTEVIAVMSIWVYVVQLILIFVPFIWIVFYISIRLWAFCCRVCKKNDGDGNEADGDENEATGLVHDNT